LKLFDLHCDTISRSINENKSIFDGDLHVNFKKLEKFEEYVGCFAIWIPDLFCGKRAWRLFEKSIYKLNSEIKRYISFENEIKRIKIITTIEGGTVIGRDLSKILVLKSKGVKMLGLTWNGKCDIGDGSGVENAKGITEFGVNVVKELEKNNIIIDISHASDKLFYDICELATKPFVATHSNSRNVCYHRRNLLDEQFLAIRQRNGIVGVNFCVNFLNSSGNASIVDIFNHIEKFLSLSGENHVCLGSDFDGTTVPKEINDVSKVDELYEFLLKKNYSENLVKKIFFDNANNFFDGFA
jgi:membrane dipeptidase